MILIPKHQLSVPTLSVAVATSSENGVVEDATDGAEFVISVEEGTPPASLTVRIMADDGLHSFIASGQSDTITIASADFPYTHSVDLDDDTIDEFAGEVTLTLLSDSPATPGDPHTYAVAATPNDSASVTVSDDDAPPSVTIAATTPGATEGGTLTFRLTCY